MKKPLYNRILVSREFDRRADAERFAQEMRAQYRDAGISLKYDVTRTPQSTWKATVYAKVSDQDRT